MASLLHAAWPAALVVIVLGALSAAPLAAFAHLDHLPHYNGNESHTEHYFIHQALDPEYAAPGEPAAVLFSIQDGNGKDVPNVETMVEIYASDGQRLQAFPWTKYDVGDFTVYYTFPDAANYQIVLSIADGPVNSNGVDPPRGTLVSSHGCNCERVVFNVNISRSFGTIFTSTILGALLVPTAGLGALMWYNYKSKKNTPGGMTTGELVRYAVMLAAVAGGMVHFAVYSEHGSLRLEYPIFLITAGGMQVSYGMMYILLTLSSADGWRSAAGPRQYYRKTVALNLFGLAGTAVLLGLYIYSVIFPPPLSPVNKPEDVSLAGVLAKSVEVFLVGGILYLMRQEKKKLQAVLASKT
jgi:hypothetical protein